MALSHKKKTYTHLSSITFFIIFILLKARWKITTGFLEHTPKKGGENLFCYLNAFYLLRTNKSKAIKACRNDQLKNVIAVILVTNHGPFGYLFMTISL